MDNSSNSFGINMVVTRVDKPKLVQTLDTNKNINTKPSTTKVSDNISQQFTDELNKQYGNKNEK
jgi:hypothetical protein